MNRIVVALLCLGLLGAGSVQAQVWKCKNLKTGQIEYSDIQCDGKSTAAATISARPNELDSSGSREQAARLLQREQNEEFQRQAEALRRQASEARGSTGGGNDACTTAESAYERAKAGRAAPSIMQGLKNRVSAACGRAPASAREVRPRINTPANITTCDDGGCWDTGGTRYNGSGGTYFSSNGQTCQRIGTQMQCN